MAKRPAECGTVSGYGSHRYRGETPCNECKAAMSEYNKNRKLERKAEADEDKPSEALEGVVETETTQESITDHEDALEVLDDVLAGLKDSFRAAEPKEQAPLAKAIRDTLSEMTTRRTALHKLRNPQVVQAPQQSQQATNKYELTITPKMPSENNSTE